jgi:hypothetical protein
MNDSSKSMFDRTVRRNTMSEVMSALPFIFGVVVALIYLWYYLADPALPGNNSAYPLGWWGWFDQSQYIESARALRAFDFSPARNWYPLGYSLLAAPFTRWLPMHPLFFVDLTCLLISYVAFLLFAWKLQVSPSLAAIIFVLAGMGDPRLAKVWAEPWNTTASAALIWSLLACSAFQLSAPARGQDLRRTARLFAFGMLMGALPLVRPTDALISAFCGCTVALNQASRRQVRLSDVATVVLGGLLVVVPYGLLYLRIYGWHATAYMVHSRTLGFAFSQLPWKTYVLLIEPHPWFPYGVSLLARCPWLVLALAGIVPALVSLRGPARWTACLLATSSIAYCALFFSYIDLLPSGLWRYENVHYFKWEFPGLALFAWFLIREFWGARKRLAAACLVATVAVTSVRVVAMPVDQEHAARMVQFPGIHLTWEKSYLSTSLTLRDSRGKVVSVTGMRVLPDGEGLRALALRREFVGPVRWTQDNAPDADAYHRVPRRWGERVTFGYPCWMPPYPCRTLPPHS